MNNEGGPPIDWPQWWKGQGNHFLEGAPFIGTHCRIINCVRGVLSCRDQELFDLAWAQSGYSIERCRSISEQVGSLVKPYIAWPNYYFFPDDRLALLLGVIPGVWFDAEDPVEDVRKHWHLPGLKENDSNYYNLVLSGRFKDLVDLINKG